MQYHSQPLKTMFSPVWALFGSYKVKFRLIGAESLTLGKTSQLRLETSLISSNYT